MCYGVMQFPTNIIYLFFLVVVNKLAVSSQVKGVEGIKRTRGRPRKGENGRRVTGKAHTFYCDDALVDRWKKKVGNISEKIREYILADLEKENDVVKYDLESAKQQLQSLAEEDIRLEKRLGGKRSKCYLGLQAKAVELGLKVDYSNLDEVLIKLMDYVPCRDDPFSVSEILLFCNKLEVMRDKRLLKAEVVVKTKESLAKN